ncbi:MAG: hypothetical protein ATN31_09065 [Candidatus Epulonipiscioides saccharophilum]|nr:MAG: hypothetical protein ATN31_09065 [Epulopiscium sp. AS2M-Bin001]
MWKIEEHILETPYLKKNITRKIRVYLPNKYDIDDKAYPVVYFHDGKAVFYGSGPFGTGSWEVLDTVTRIEAEGKSEGYIIVAMDNAEEERAIEYLPFKQSSSIKFGDEEIGGKAFEYAEFFVEKLMPFIASKYRTAEASIIGSSMGGLVTAFIVSKYPDKFVKVGVFSIASWVYKNNEFIDYLKTNKANKHMKYFVHVGTEEGHLANELELAQIYVNDTIKYVRTLLELGVPIENIDLNVGVGDTHSERSWSKYVEQFLLF